jgi:hypothetical protein
VRSGCGDGKRLEHPYGRIALVPANGRKLELVIKDDTGVRTKARMVQIEPGQWLVVTW